MKQRPAVVVGLGCIAAAGDSLPQILEALYSGRRKPRPPAHIKTDLDAPPPVFEVFSELDRFAPSGGTSRTTLLCLAAIAEALDQARLSPVHLARRRVGVALGTTVGCTLNDDPFYRAFHAGENPAISPVVRYMKNNPALYVAGRFSLEGPVATVANACSSGTDAIGLAKLWIENDVCDIAIAGGCDELSRTAYLGFYALQVTSPEPCLPFDRRRRGLNLGEGAGILVLESMESAKNRRARPQAVACGYGSSSDAHHPTAPHPEGLGLQRAIQAALKDAAAKAEDVALVNAHGTSTMDNDRIEGRVLARCLKAGVPVVSTKSYTGHTLGAAGGIEAVLTVQALKDGRLPATAGFEEPDAECGIIPTRENTPVSGSLGMSTSLAFGGNNSVLLFSGDIA